MDDMPSRVAVLEQIARETHDAIGELRAEMQALRADIAAEMRATRADMAAMRAEARADYRWLPVIMLAGFGTMLAAYGALLAVMAHGFHWL
jgi:hypothetical protein